jgi:hypothetical protein
VVVGTKLDCQLSRRWRHTIRRWCQVLAESLIWVFAILWQGGIRHTISINWVVKCSRKLQTCVYFPCTASESEEAIHDFRSLCQPTDTEKASNRNSSNSCLWYWKNLCSFFVAWTFGVWASYPMHQSDFTFSRGLVGEALGDCSVRWANYCIHDLRISGLICNLLSLRQSGHFELSSLVCYTCDQNPPARHEGLPEELREVGILEYLAPHIMKYDWRMALS